MRAEDEPERDSHRFVERMDGWTLGDAETARISNIISYDSIPPHCDLRLICRLDLRPGTFERFIMGCDTSVIAPYHRCTQFSLFI